MSNEKNVPENNYVKTANRTGVMTRHIDFIGQEGIKFSKNIKAPILEVGCANGFLCQELLNQGNNVIATDISELHLQTLRSSISKEQNKKLETYKGAFPKIPLLDKESIGAVISIWVFHFFTGEELQKAANRLFDALIPEGKVFLSMSSPYVKFLGSFIPKYEERVNSGELFPGWVDDVSLYLTPKQVENLPKSMHFLDPKVLRRIFSKAGFTIEYADFFRRDDVTESMSFDGRENVGLIAKK